MRSSNRPVAGLGLALTAALLGLATVTAVATADPSSPAPTSSSSAPETSSSGEEPPPSSSEPETPPANAESRDLRVTATFDKPSYTTGEKITATVTVENTGADPITTSASFPRRADMITVAPGENPIKDVTLDAGASLTRVVTGTVGDPDVTTARLYVEFGGREFSFPVTITTKTGSVTRPLDTVLAVRTEFTKDTYEKDETPTVRVTLTNKDRLSLTNIVATCDYDGQYPNLTGKGAGWGDLAGDGVTIPANSTRILEVTEPMPKTAYDFGYLRVDCEFRQSGVDYGANPRASDEAAVPGQVAEFSGEITNNDPGASRAGFRVVLTRKGGDCPIVGEDTSDVAGRFSLGRLPVGQYDMYVVPPGPRWYFKYGNHVPVNVIANRDNDYYLIWVYEGLSDNPDLARPPDCAGGPGGPGGAGGNPPAPRGSAAPGLAYTGASLIVPGLAGMVALLLGSGAVLLTRRRRAS